MEYTEIKKLITDMEISKLHTLNIELPDGTKINMTKKENGFDVSEELSKTKKEEKVNSNFNEVLLEDRTEFKKDEGNIVKSPMVGTFYESSSPGKEAFVRLGTKVKKGDTLCIIEAMKLMNEIESEFDGEVVEVLVKNEEVVDYGKPLFKII